VEEGEIVVAFVVFFFLLFEFLWTKGGSSGREREDLLNIIAPNGGKTINEGTRGMFGNRVG
jgi:hypothetical protein